MLGPIILLLVVLWIARDHATTRAPELPGDGAAPPPLRDLSHVLGVDLEDVAGDVQDGEAFALYWDQPFLTNAGPGRGLTIDEALAGVSRIRSDWFRHLWFPASKVKLSTLTSADFQKAMGLLSQAYKHAAGPNDSEVFRWIAQLKADAAARAQEDAQIGIFTGIIDALGAAGGGSAYTTFKKLDTLAQVAAEGSLPSTVSGPAPFEIPNMKEWLWSLGNGRPGDLPIDEKYCPGRPVAMNGTTWASPMDGAEGEALDASYEVDSSKYFVTFSGDFDGLIDGGTLTRKYWRFAEGIVEWDRPDGRGTFTMNARLFTMVGDLLGFVLPWASVEMGAGKGLRDRINDVARVFRAIDVLRCLCNPDIAFDGSGSTLGPKKCVYRYQSQALGIHMMGSIFPPIIADGDQLIHGFDEHGFPWAGIVSTFHLDVPVAGVTAPPDAPTSFGAALATAYTAAAQTESHEVDLPTIEPASVASDAPTVIGGAIETYTPVRLVAEPVAPVAPPSVDLTAVVEPAPAPVNVTTYAPPAPSRFTTYRG